MGKIFKHFNELKKHPFCHSYQLYEYITSHERFPQPDDLKACSVVHTDKHPYESLVCGKKFKLQNKL